MRTHKNSTSSVTYDSVVSCETFRIALTIAVLNELQVKCGNFLNAYIAAPIMELIWTTFGTEFRNDQGKMAIFVSALYGLKSIGVVFCKHLGEFMSGLGYKLCLADPDFWLNPEVREMALSATRIYFVMLMTSWFYTTMPGLL